MIRKAVLKDVSRIHELIECYARKGDMLPRPISEIYAYIRSFFVYEKDGKIIATCSLQVCLDGLGEVRSLAVEEGGEGRGVGKELVLACLDEARYLGLERVFALTYSPGFFCKLGFSDTEKETLPHKIWGECVKCSKFPNCDENAVIIDLRKDLREAANE